MRSSLWLASLILMMASIEGEGVPAALAKAQSASISLSATESSHMVQKPLPRPSAPLRPQGAPLFKAAGVLVYEIFLCET